MGTILGTIGWGFRRDGPLTALACASPRLEVIAFIDSPQTIRQILEHLQVWVLPARPPPAASL